MVAYLYRMGAGFPGDVTRTHPVSIEPTQVDPANPPALFGGLVFADQTTVDGVRNPTAADASATPISGYGILVRSFPTQQQTTSQAYGAVGLGSGTPPIQGTVDVLRAGYILGTLNSGAAGTPTKGAPVFVWVGATIAGHVQGGLETAATANNTVQLDGKTTFNGGPDASGTIEIGFNV
jgi:hypothetical protein